MQTHEDSNDDMEGLSHAFGLLLQYSGIKLQLTTSVAVSDVKRTVSFCVLYQVSAFLGR